jgi:hypothetical protein
MAFQFESCFENWQNILPSSCCFGDIFFLLMNGSLTCWILGIVHFWGLIRIEEKGHGCLAPIKASHKNS